MCDGAVFPKLIDKLYHLIEGTDVTCAGISSAGGDSKSAAENIDYSLEVYDSEDEKVTLSNQGSSKRKTEGVI